MRTDRLKAADEIEFRYTLFPLHPDTPDEGLTLEQLFAGRSFDIEAMQAKLAGLMVEEGLPYGERAMIYLLRCQLVHGAATLRSRMNRTAVKHCTTMMAKLMPTLLLVWIDHGADEDWGIMCYPPVDAAARGGR